MKELLIRLGIHFSIHKIKEKGRELFGFDSFDESEKARTELESNGYFLVMSYKRDNVFYDIYQ